MTASTVQTMDASSSRLGQQVRARLDDYVQGQCDAETLGPAMSIFCKSAPDAAWEVLAILDQYHRKGELPEDVFQSLKATVNRIAFNVRETAPIHDDRVRDDRAPPSDATRSRFSAPPPQHSVVEDDVEEDVEEDDAEPMDSVTMIRSHSSAPSAPPPTPTPFPVFAAPKQPAPSVLDSFRSLSPGDVLRDRYVIESLLAFGQHTAIFKAQDKHRANFPAAGHHVALKVLNRAASPEALAKFEHEFQLAQQLSHPNIVNVFDLDRDGDWHFFSMELLEGQTLSQFAERSPLNSSKAAALIGQLGNALAYVHDRNIVHGELEPENVMLTREGDVKLLDFGAASVMVYEPWISTSETQPSAKAAMYASCERLEGMPADKRDDIFSLACIAYELFADEHPFLRQFATRARDTKQKPRRIRALSTRRWRALSQGLAWSRNERPASLRAWLAQMDIHEGLLLTSAEFASVRRKSTLYRTGLTLGVAALAALLFVTWEFDPAKAPGWLTSAQSRARDALQRPPVAANASSSADIPDNGIVVQPDTIATVPDTGPADAAASAQTATPVPANQSVAASAAKSTQSAGPDSAAAATAGGTGKPADANSDRMAGGTARLSFLSENFLVKKSDSAARITIQRTGSAARKVSFMWWAESGTAEAGKDFVPLGQKTEYLQPGERQVVVFVPIVSGVQRNAGNVFFVSLADPSDNAALGNITRARVILADE